MRDLSSQSQQIGELVLTGTMRGLSAQREPGQSLRFIAHQGAQGDYPTNSLPALEAAFGVADCVELDLYVANRGDGSPEIVAIHPEGYFLNVSRTPMQNEAPLPMTFEQTRAFQVAGRPMIPTIDEVVDSYVAACARTGKRSELHFELKGPGTAEVAIDKLRGRIATGDLSYEDFALTGLCYPGDRARLLKARELDPRVRLVFVARGGDYAVDGFQGLDDAILFARSIGADTFTVARRGLSLDDAAKIKAAGFRLGTFHCRTSDEAEAAISLGAEYVAADLFRGASILSYPGARVGGCPLYDDLCKLRLFHARDWIWEIGWEAEKSAEAARRLREPLVETAPQLASAGGVWLGADGRTILRWTDKGKVTGDWVELSSIAITGKYLAPSADAGNSLTTWQRLLNPEKAVEDTARLVCAMGHQTKLDQMVNRLGRGRLDFEAVVTLSQQVPDSGDRGEVVVTEVARQVLTLYGRLLGVAAFTALRPRHGDKDSYTVVIEACHTRNSHWIKLAAEQQVAAQGLRSGKRCSALFL